MKESELLRVWLWKFHRDRPQWRNVRLGPLPDKEIARMYLVTLRWADAIFIYNGEIYIVEAKLWPQPGAIAQLELYQKLIRQTPEFNQYAENPIRLLFLTTSMDLPIAEMCSEKNIIYEVFNYDDYIAAKQEMIRPINVYNKDLRLPSE